MNGPYAVYTVSIVCSHQIQYHTYTSRRENFDHPHYRTLNSFPNIEISTHALLWTNPQLELSIDMPADRRFKLQTPIGWHSFQTSVNNLQVMKIKKKNVMNALINRLVAESSRSTILLLIPFKTELPKSIFRSLSNDDTSGIPEEEIDRSPLVFRRRSNRDPPMRL